MGCILKGGGGLYSRLVVGAVLLAAGKGERMRNRPKALLELAGVPLIRRQLIALSGAGVDDVVVVLGHHHTAIEPLVRDFPVTIVRNENPDAGHVSSLRVGLAELGANIDAVVVALADQPLIGTADVQDLIGAYKKRPSGTDVVQPWVDDQPGNPVIFGATVRDGILAGDTRVGCRQWQASHPEKVHRWLSTNTRYRTDVDTPEDIERLAERTGHRLRWPARWSDAE